MRAKMMHNPCSRRCCGAGYNDRRYRAKEKRDWKAYEQAAEHEQPRRAHGGRW